MGTSLALVVMNELPLGLPKVILSTVAYSPAINPEMLCGDIIMLPWLAGLWGLNKMARRVLEQAAATIVATVEAYEPQPLNEKKLLGATSLGQTASKYLQYLKPALEGRGYEVAVFHATGMGSRAFEKAIMQGLFEAVLDLQVGKELLNFVCGSVVSSGPHRLESAGKLGIPQIVAPGNIQSFLWAATQPLPRRFKNRFIHEHNSLFTVISSIAEEKRAAGKLMAEKLNMATGPTAVVLPLQSASLISKTSYSDLRGLQAFRNALKRNIKPEVKILEIDADINDPAFSDGVLTLFDEMMQ